MSRTRGLIAAGAVAVATIAALPAAGAQTPTTGYGGDTVPSSTTTAAPTTTAAADTSVTSDDTLGPSAEVDLTVSDPDITAGIKTGTVQSTPTALPPTQATAGKVTFANVKLPADFARNANHTITVVDQATGKVQATKAFGVDANGKIVAPLSGSDLPRTGNDTEPLLKAGGALLAIGAAAVVVARRRRQSADAAA